MLEDLTAGARQAAIAGLLRARLARVISVQNPAAGADWSCTPPGGSVWELLSVEALLTASAVVANRLPSLRLDDGSEQYWAESAGGAQVAATAVRHVFYVSPPRAGLDGSNNVSISGLLAGFVGSGQHLFTSTSGLDVGDQWSRIRIAVVEWSLSDVAAQADWIASRLR